MNKDAAPDKGKPKTIIIIAVIAAALVLSCAILAVLAAFLLPALISARAKADQVRCANNLKVQSIALVLYQTTERAYPNPADADGFGAYTELLEKKYLDDPAVCFCPGQGQPVGTLSPETCGYVVLSLKAPANPGASFPVAWCREPHPDDKRNVAYADSRVETLEEQAFQALLAKATARYGRRPLPK